MTSENGIGAASQCPATREFNMGGVADVTTMLEQETKSLNELLREGHNEGQRATAILLAANLYNRLYAILEAFLCVDPKEAQKLLKGAHAALGSFSSKIRSCLYLGLITDDEAHDLNRIREIRNIFAHQEHGLTFETQEIDSHCKALRLPKKLEAAGGLNGFDLTNNLNTYRLGAMTLSMWLAARVAEAKAQRRSPRQEWPIGKAMG
jgi:hypothetical protein